MLSTFPRNSRRFHMISNTLPIICFFGCFLSDPSTKSVFWHTDNWTGSSGLLVTHSMSMYSVIFYNIKGSVMLQKFNLGFKPIIPQLKVIKFLSILKVTFWVESSNLPHLKMILLSKMKNLILKRFNQFPQPKIYDQGSRIKDLGSRN